MQNILGFILIPWLSLVVFFEPTLVAQSQDQKQTEQESLEATDTALNDENATQIKPYDEIITEDAISEEGVFTVHQIKEKVYYEIPTDELNTEFLWVGQIAKTTAGAGFGGQAIGNRVVRWERREKRILLRSVSYAIVANSELPISQAVQAANNDTILKIFEIETFGELEAPVIDVTSLFTNELTEFSARIKIGASSFDQQRSFVESVSAFPRNIEVRATHTYTKPPSSQSSTATPIFRQHGMQPGSASVVVHYSMVKLPEHPMQPRLFDERVGYFSIRQHDFGRNEHRAVERRYITRWRLEKQDPLVEVSDPITPIVFWIDPATPKKWVPYLKAGVESWQVAFEEAGFSNAIIAREAPTPAEDATWNAEDARYSVIRWIPSTVQNAMGPHIHDPRTGEILEADIEFHHNIMNLIRDWYFVQVGPLDERARNLPLPDDLMGQLLQYVAAHEVGHTIGFQHNMKASSMYPLENVRNPAWVKTHGHTPTLMDYSRFNYVAQPEDKIAPSDLIPKIGPYDKWATMWGYKPILETTNPDDEKSTLDKWARAQDDTPWYRFTTTDSRGADPGELTEAVGDADSITATTLGLKNLERVSEMLLTATSKPGEPYDELKVLYERLVNQWAIELNHVAAIVGGFESQQKHVGQNGVRFVPIPRNRQKEAVAFLNSHAFNTPDFLIKPEILRRIESTGTIARIGFTQQRILYNLLDSMRITRLVEQQTIESDKAYMATEFLEELRNGIWSELKNKSIEIDAYRRNIQRSYLSIMEEKLNGILAVTNDERALLRGELKSITKTLKLAIERANDRITLLHLEDALDQIARSLDPSFSVATSQRSLVSLLNQIDIENNQPRLDPSNPTTPFICWPSYALEKKVQIP